MSVSLLFRLLKIGRIAGIDIFLHWTMWAFPIFILVRGLILYSIDETLLQTLLVLGAYASLFIHEMGHIFAAGALGLPIRNVTMFPICGYDRLAEISDRPWKEIRFALVGPLVHGIIAGVIAAVFLAADWGLSPRLDSSQPNAENYLNRLFWLNVLLAICQALPAFPMDGGRLFRSALALSAGRQRATEVASLFASFVALALIVSGMIWMSLVWWLIVLGIIVHVSGQQEWMSERFFASIQEPESYIPGRAPIHVSADQLLDDLPRPTETNFTGLTWNPKNRLWIVWKNGSPVSGNALVGE